MANTASDLMTALDKATTTWEAAANHVISEDFSQESIDAFKAATAAFNDERHRILFGY